MSQYDNLKATIALNVYQNHNNEVTANMVKAAMDAMTDSLGAGYQYLGIATPTSPGTAQTPDQKVFYIATTPGTYTYLGGLVVNDGEVAVLKWDTAWHKEVTGAATAAQVTELGQQIADLSLGKFYGFFPNASNLPAGDMPGYAYVGAASPFSIYVFKDGAWSDSGSVYAPSEGNGEDIDTNAQGKLQFANRPTTYGMGYKILRRGASFASQVGDSDTIYEIRYDFDLENASVTIPANCVLKFNGGSLSNGTINAGNGVYFANPICEGVRLLVGNNNRITGGKIHNEDANCVEIQSKTNVTIENCVFYTTKDNTEEKRVSPIYITNSQYIDLHGCNIYGSKWKVYGGVTNFYQDPACCIYIYNSSDVQIKDNVVYNSIYECIYCKTGARISIIGNTSYDVGYSCIACVDIDGLIVKNNLCYNSGASCITAQSDNFIISGNIVHTNASGNGITAKHSSAEGETPNYTSGTVSNNIVYNFRNTGISFAETKSIIVSDNQILDSVDDGVTCYGIRIRYTDSSEETIVKVTGNVIKNVVGAGMYFNVSDKSKISVSNNYVSDCSTYGLSCIGVGLFMVENNQFINVREGVNLYSSATITDNSVSNFLTAGVILKDGVENATLVGNKFEASSTTSSLKGFLHYDNTIQFSSNVSLDIKDNTFISMSAIIPILNIPNNKLYGSGFNTFNFLGNTILFSGLLNYRDTIVNTRNNNVSIKYLHNRHNNIILENDCVQNFADLPYLANSERGYFCYVLEKGLLYFWTGSNWKTTYSTKGENRPDDVLIGTVFFDTVLGKPIWWDGSAWVDATGTAV